MIIFTQFVFFQQAVDTQFVRGLSLELKLYNFMCSKKNSNRESHKIIKRSSLMYIILVRGSFLHLLYKQMKSNNFQFTFSLGIDSEQSSQQEALFKLYADIFPYLKTKSVTLVMQLLSLIPFLLEVKYSTIMPDQSASFESLFKVVLAYLVKSMLFLRLGSEFQQKLGVKYFLVVNSLVLGMHVILEMVLGLRILEGILNGFPSLSIFILLIVDLNKFKESELIQFEQEEKVVENYDLLDLNDTIVKLKPRQSTFTYENYTNREFYNHNITTSKSKQKKSPAKSRIRSNLKKANTISQLIDQPLAVSESQSMQIKIYKVILFHFAMFAHQQIYQFWILVVSEMVIYFSVSSKIIKKLFQ